VTANQSASPPIMAASAVARRYPNPGQRVSRIRDTMYTAHASTSSPVARRFMLVSCTCFCSSSWIG
jgi:hypothetical protein